MATPTLTSASEPVHPSYRCPSCGALYPTTSVRLKTCAVTTCKAEPLVCWCDADCPEGRTHEQPVQANMCRIGRKLRPVFALGGKSTGSSSSRKRQPRLKLKQKQKTPQLESPDSEEDEPAREEASPPVHRHPKRKRVPKKHSSAEAEAGAAVSRKRKRPPKSSPKPASKPKVKPAAVESIKPKVKPAAVEGIKLKVKPAAAEGIKPKVKPAAAESSKAKAKAKAKPAAVEGIKPKAKSAAVERIKPKAKTKTAPPTKISSSSDDETTSSDTEQPQKKQKPERAPVKRPNAKAGTKSSVAGKPRPVKAKVKTADREPIEGAVAKPPEAKQGPVSAGSEEKAVALVAIIADSSTASTVTASAVIVTAPTPPMAATVAAPISMLPPSPRLMADVDKVTHIETSRWMTDDDEDGNDSSQVVASTDNDIREMAYAKWAEQLTKQRKQLVLKPLAPLPPSVKDRDPEFKHWSEFKAVLADPSGLRSLTSYLRTMRDGW